jgi:hypothetical protein
VQFLCSLLDRSLVPQVLTEDQEQFGMALLIEHALRRHPLSEQEWCRWASATAARNGTRTSAAPDMRKWYIYATGRILREFGFEIQKMQTEQVSTARAGVLLSNVRAYQTNISEFLVEKPELASEGLRAHGNSDEAKIDLNDLLQRRGLVPEGMEAKWETEAERCPQITFLGGFQGYLDKERAGKQGRACSLPEVRELFWRARADDATLDGELAAKLRAMGQVAGYPKLQPGIWDCDDFCILPGMLIFNAGDTAPDPAWSDFVFDKDRLTVTSTESGYINSDLKCGWYRHCKAQSWVPWGKRPTMPTADHHASNETVELSAEMEADEAYLCGAPGHSTHLLQDCDQRGGPIQHFKRIGGDLLCHSYRVHGSLSRARISQCVELSYVLSYTPAVCAYATVRVGWGEDTDGNLTYEPLAYQHIVSKLVDDESASSSSTTTLAPADWAASSSSERLALFKAGALDGHVGIAAAREAMRETLGKGTRPEDGWANEEDMPDGTFGEAGSRSRRNRNDQGGIMASAQYRANVAIGGKTTADKEAAARIAVFKGWKTDAAVLELNAAAEGKLASNGKLSNEEMIGFIRARTNKPVPQAEKKAQLLEARLATLVGKPVVVKLPMQPDGYGEWLLQEQQAAATKAATKAAAKEATLRELTEAGGNDAAATTVTAATVVVEVAPPPPQEEPPMPAAPPQAKRPCRGRAGS